MSERSDTIYRLRRENPNWPAAEIARHVGCSRERVRQLLNRTGLPTKAMLPPPPDYGCCAGCGVKATAKRKGDFCLLCRRSRVTQLVCVNCKTQFTRKAYMEERSVRHGRRTGPFCGKRCHGFWLAVRYGITRENYQERVAKRRVITPP